MRREGRPDTSGRGARGAGIGLCIGDNRRSSQTGERDEVNGSTAASARSSLGAKTPASARAIVGNIAQTPPADAQFAPRYVASLVHARRSRLNAVLGGLERVRQTVLGEEHRRFVDTAMDEGRALLQRVSDALELGPLDAGELNIERHPLHPVAIAEGALATVAAHRHQRGIVCASVVDPETPVAVIGDGSRLHQVLHHLLDNARRATESGRRLPAGSSAHANRR